MPEIILKNVSKSFGKTVAVEELNLQILDNSFVTLLGPSGCGKTTILRMIAGLETPTEGKISIGGRVVFDSERGISLAPDKRNVGFLFQNYALWPHMTVYQNIAFGLENMRWDRDRIKKRVDELLRMLRIEQYVSRYPSELSGGQQQRVAIARTLAPSPKVLLMDEPLSNLDAKLRAEMRTELKRLHTDASATFVYVTHDQLEAMTLSTRVCLMDSGRLQQYASPLEIYKRPVNLFAAGFVGNPTMNFIPARVMDGSGTEWRLSLLEKEALYTADAPVTGLGKEALLGVRPEYLPIRPGGPLTAAIYSTLPTGMETTVKASCGGVMLTSVVFGSVDYPVDAQVSMDVAGASIVLFDKETGRNTGVGRLSIL